MSRNPFARLVLLSLALLFAACAAYQAQHRSAAPSSASAPGIAPAAVPPSGEFRGLPPDLQISRIQGEIAEARTQLAQQGHYACCVDPPCSQCLLKFGRCGCREAVRKGGDFCGECTEGWVEGRGIVEGVDAKELLERRRKSREEANPESGGAPPPHEHRHHHP